MPEPKLLEGLQSLPLYRKIMITQTRIIEWYQHYDGKVYVSFSGGKDSTVLLDLVRRAYPDVPAVFIDTGLEYPEIREFAKTIPNTTFVKPEMNFRQVIEKYGYPVISKEQSQRIRELRTQNLSPWFREKRMKQLGTKWQKMLDAPFESSEQCCNVMKKRTAKRYERETGRHPFIGVMAAESAFRKQQWIRYGCNSFDGKRPASRPMSFWTEQDVLEYLHTYNIPYASVYGEIVKVNGGGVEDDWM